MPEHKMVTIEGVRYRSEDAPKGYTPPARTPTTRSVAPEAAEYDPTAHTVEEVLAYLDEADAEEAEEIYRAEAAGKARTTILKTRETGGDGGGSEEEDSGDGDSSGAAG